MASFTAFLITAIITRMLENNNPSVTVAGVIEMYGQLVDKRVPL
ncbi:hypothetical protein SDC9_82593 [bioreactor metagenome]|uniref:Uncharacterized protein n=1 Tax=bioreactor metagenome TaxID=1076179 RepID=A0A644Z6T3_9ZZZZ